MHTSFCDIELHHFAAALTQMRHDLVHACGRIHHLVLVKEQT